MVATTAPNKSNAGCQGICMRGRIAYRLSNRKSAVWARARNEAHRKGRRHYDFPHHASAHVAGRTGRRRYRKMKPFLLCFHGYMVA